MRKNYKALLASVTLLCIAAFIPKGLNAQACTNTALGSNCTRSNFYYGEILPNAGCGVFTQVTGYGPGYYFRIPVLTGGCYTVSTCGASIDTQIGNFQGNLTTGPFSYDDDNGPDCSGTAASAVMVPNFTDYVRVDVRQYNCAPGGTASITVKVRQNNNLSITSASTDMCQGATRALTAVPARVTVAPQAGSGDVGTFTGTGVSGTNFTAPTPSGSSGTYTITYTFGYCSTTQNINVFKTPTASNAGPNQTVCSASATLAANAPAVGTGAWSVVSGPGTVATPSSPNSVVNGLTTATPTVLRWTISNGPCTASTSDVTITRTADPTVANAGPNQTICAISAAMAGNAPSVGTGAWTLIGGNGTIQTAGSPSTNVNNIGVGLNTFVWTITNGVCPASTDTVVITRDAQPTTANAGPDQSICDSTTNLAGNAPSVGTGMWMLSTGSGTVATMSDPNSAVSAINVGTSVFRWTITNGVCPASVDSVAITRNALPAAPTVTGNLNVCSGGSTVLTASSGVAGPNYVWWDAPTGGSSLSSTAVYNTPSLTSTTSFYVNVQDGSTNCISPRTQVTINVNPTPNPSLGPDTTFCAGDTMCLTPGSQYTGYIWNNGFSLATNCVTAAGSYWVIVTDSNFCQGGDTIVLTTRPSPTVNLGPNVTFCANASSNIGVAPTAGYTYMWSTGDTTSQISITQAGTYTLTAMDSTGCSGSGSITATTSPLPTSGFTVDTTNCPLIAFTNTTVNGTSFAWNFGDNQTSTNQSPLHNYSGAGNGTYNVQLVSTNNCGNDTLVVPVVINCLVGIENPTLVSLSVYPNPSTGIFKVAVDGLEQNATLRLYNAAGQMILSRDIQGGRGSFTEDFNVEVAKGIYFLKMDVDGQQFTKRLVIE